MLSVKPNTRPNILDILNKSFVRKKTLQYVNECINGPPMELSPTDVDDMYFDSSERASRKIRFNEWTRRKLVSTWSFKARKRSYFRSNECQENEKSNGRRLLNATIKESTCLNR